MSGEITKEEMAAFRKFQDAVKSVRGDTRLLRQLINRVDKIISDMQVHILACSEGTFFTIPVWKVKEFRQALRDALQKTGRWQH